MTIYQNEMHLGLLDPLNGGEIIHARSPARWTLNALKVMKFPESWHADIKFISFQVLPYHFLVLTHFNFVYETWFRQNILGSKVITNRAKVQATIIGRDKNNELMSILFVDQIMLPAPKVPDSCIFHFQFYCAY